MDPKDLADCFKTLKLEDQKVLTAFLSLLKQEGVPEPAELWLSCNNTQIELIYKIGVFTVARAVNLPLGPSTTWASIAKAIKKSIEQFERTATSEKAW